MSLIIEQFTPKHQKATKDFILDTWKEFGFTYVPEEDADLDDIQKHYIDNLGMFYILRDGIKIIGTIGVIVRPENVVELTRLYVDKSQQGKGFGSQLVDKIIEFSRNNGFSKIELNTNKIFQKAHSLYQHKGFQITKEDRQDFWMEKLLK